MICPGTLRALTARTDNRAKEVCMSKVVFDISMSLDGFITASNRRAQTNPRVTVGSGCTSGRPG